ncbi:MAG: hypothetical protein LBB41_01775 [Prevotellaceae bacterium]|jgi:hypothetical protein|nr:hypothetical protein [Prevotellaceae bacterium]
MKNLLIVMCLFCAALSSAQNSTFIDKWEAQARSRAASWNSYTRTATAANRPTYTSLYVKGKVLASFNDAGTCRSKILELKQLAGNMYGKQSSSSSSSRSNSSIGKGGQATRDLERMTGVNLNEMVRASNALDGLKAEADAKSKQKILSQIEGYCSCRTENNPNYDFNTKPGNFGYGDLFTSNDNEKTDNENPSNSPFADKSPPHIFDMPSARNSQQPPTGAKVSLNFEHLETSVGSTGRGIHVDNPNWKSDWQTPVERIESNKENSIEAEMRERERIAALNPFDLELLNLKKTALERQLKEYRDLCKGTIDCPWNTEMNKIQDAIDVLDNQIAGREKWLEDIGKMSDDVLEAQEKNYKNLEEMAGLANCSYEGRKIPDGWKKCIDFACIDQTNINGAESGFRCELLYNENTKKYVLSFRGTDDINDVLKAWAEGNYVKTDEQTALAMQVTKDLLNKGIDPKDLQLTGHSLGGRLAAETAVENGLIAYTFNSADVSLETRSGEKVKTSGNILNTVSANDILTSSSFGLGASTSSIPLAGNSKQGVNKNWSSNTYSPGYTNVIQEAYGNSKLDAHDMNFLLNSIKQRHSDIVTYRNKK